MTDVAVYGAVAGAIVSWAASEVARATMVRRAFWSLAAALMLVHSVAAFGAIYGWSHEVAVVATARQTQDLTGFDSGSGIYVNYVFLLIWIADAVWWWQAPAHYAARPGWLSHFVDGFVWFMFLNGAVIFADGWMRAIGGAAVLTVLIAWIGRR